MEDFRHLAHKSESYISTVIRDALMEREKKNTDGNSLQIRLQAK